MLTKVRQATQDADGAKTFKDVRFMVKRAMLLDLVMEIDVPLYFFSVS